MRARGVPSKPLISSSRKHDFGARLNSEDSVIRKHDYGVRLNSEDSIIRGKLGKPRKKKDQDLVSPFWLNCAGYTVVFLVVLSAVMVLSLAWQFGVIGYENRGAVYDVYDYLTTREEL
eukprot:TRINITY_DN71871_c0_g1_i1.p1 TRINITY_DN71871_c0_g1~~TRINITY_DN71871_c0_g1_i1.p1  ORF type:complete len:118 (+),score=23.28 TRINITY_DN71871_c0_g1_i1:61-414(+)